MKIIAIILPFLIIIMSFTVMATPIINMTFDLSDGVYNTTDAENLGLVTDFKVQGAFYNQSGLGYGGFYTCASLRYLNASSRFRTISADGTEVSAFVWIIVKPSNTGMLVTHYDTSGGGQRSWSLELDANSKPKVLISDNGANVRKSYTAEIEVDDGLAHFVGFTVKGNALNIYVDGVNYTTITKTTDTAITSIHPSTYQPLICGRGNIGVVQGQPTLSIDNVNVFNRTLTPAEVGRLYDSQEEQYYPPPAPIGPVVVNMTFDTKDGYYNATRAENLGGGAEFVVTGAPHNLSGRGYDGYYTCGTNRYLNMSLTRSISNDSKEVSGFAMIKGGSGINGVILSHYDTLGAGLRSYSLGLDASSRLQVLLSDDGTAVKKSYYAAQELDDALWHHVGFTYNGNTDNLQLYVNGENVSVTKTTDTSMTELFNAPTDVILCGRRNIGAVAGFINIVIDNPVIYNYEVKPANVSNLYNSIISQYGTTNFYFSSSTGDDSSTNCGLATPCKTISKYNSLLNDFILPGDNISFKRGDVWRLPLDAYPSFKNGARDNHIVYQSYETGARPSFLGGYNLSNTSHWEAGGLTNLWRTTGTYSADIGNLIFNLGTTNGQKQDAQSAVTVQGRFYKNNTNDKIYLYSTSNPGSFYTTIETANNKSIFNIITYNYMNFNDLDMRYGGLHGFQATGTNIEIHIHNNSYYWIGGAYQGPTFGTLRLGNCQEFGLAGTNLSVTHSIANHCFDACYTTQAWLSAGGNKVIKNQNYSYNQGYYCSYPWEYFNSNFTTSSTENLYIHQNTFAFLGRYNFGTNQGRVRIHRSPFNTVNSRFENNIMHNVSYRTMDFSEAKTHWGQYIQDYNLHSHSSSTSLIAWNGTNYATVAAFKAAVTTHGRNDFEADPYLIQVGENYYPTSGEACLGSSTGSHVGALRCLAENYVFNQTDMRLQLPFYDFQDKSLIITGRTLSINGTVVGVKTIRLNSGKLINSGHITLN